MVADFCVKLAVEFPKIWVWGVIEARLRGSADTGERRIVPTPKAATARG